MNMIRRKFGLSLVAVAAAFASPAGAAVETFTFDYGSPGAPVEVGSSALDFNLNQFNPAQGTLTSVSLTLISHDTIESIVDNFSARNVAFSDSTASGTVNVSAQSLFNGLATAATGAAGPYSGVALPEQATVAGTLALATQTANASPANLAPFEGTGHIPFNVVVPDANLNENVAPNLSLMADGDAFSYGEVDVVYTFAVPEASTLLAGLFGVGLCAVGLARRQQTLAVC